MEMSVEESTNKRWFVVHAYSGFEKSVAQALRDRIALDFMNGPENPGPFIARDDDDRRRRRQEAQHRAMSGLLRVELLGRLSCPSFRQDDGGA